MTLDEPGLMFPVQGAHSATFTAQDCYHGLQQYRGFRTTTKHSSSADEHKVSVHSEESADVLDISRPNVAKLFVKQAKKNLRTAEFQLLVQFLTESLTTHDVNYLRRQISAKLKAFYTAEQELTKESPATLARPSGPNDAELGLIMHCQSKEGEIGEFWDMQSSSIQALAKKGSTPDFVFCYDWHWRGEASARSQETNCPATKWLLAKRHLHNTLSGEILDTLPLPLLVIAGACPKNQYQKTFPFSARRLEVAIQPGTNINFDLDYQPDGLKRITVYVDHPQASFFQANSAGSVCVRLDAALNFSLWLVGQAYDEKAFMVRQAGHRRNVPGSAPLAELHHYYKQEQELQRPLEQHEFEQGFWSWAQQCLKEDRAAILAREESVAQKPRQIIDRKIFANFYTPERVARRATNNRRKNAERYGFTNREYWNGHAVKVH